MQNQTNHAHKIRSLVLNRAIFVFNRVRFKGFGGTPLRILASHASVFMGDRTSSLPTNERNTSSPKNACDRHLYMMDCFVYPDEKLICFV